MNSPIDKLNKLHEATEELARVGEQIKPQTYWKHRKGGIYVVRTVGLDSDSLCPMVIYSSTNANKPLFCWTRPASEFLDGRFEFLK